MITQFQGETRRESIINHFSLDIEEEDSFFEFIESMGYSEDSEDELLESLNLMFNQPNKNINILIKVCEDFVYAQGRMRDKWADVSDEKKNELWRDLHEKGDKCREMIYKIKEQK